MAGEKVTGLIVPAAIAAAPRHKKLRLPWWLKWRMLAADATYTVERACLGLFIVDSYERHGVPSKMRIDLWHPMALPAGCIFVAAIPFLALWAAIRPVVRWRDRREALRHNTEMLRIRS